MTNVIRAKVTQGGLTQAKVTPQQNILVTNYRLNAQDLRLDELTDVVATNPEDGSLLTYNAFAQVWEARANIYNPKTEFNGGFF